MTLPVDPDLTENPWPTRLRRWPTTRVDLVAAVFAGGCVGGVLRYAAVKAAPAGTGEIPWSTLTVNLAGAFVLAVVVVIAGGLVSSRYLRPLVGTGFCGALTTFSSVVVTADQLFAHRHAGAATLYLVLTIVGGVLAAVAGLISARLLVRRLRSDDEPRKAD